MINPFFKNTGPHDISFLLKKINLCNDNLSDNKVTDIKDLNSSQKNEITFLHSKKYIELAKKTKASYCLTSENFQTLLPENCKPIICLHGGLIYNQLGKKQIAKRKFDKILDQTDSSLRITEILYSFYSNNKFINQIANLKKKIGTSRNY